MKFAELILWVILPRIVNGNDTTYCFTECPSMAPHQCDFLPTRCFSSAATCDGKFDCTDGGDEMDCISTNVAETITCIMPMQETGHGSNMYFQQVLEAHNYFRCKHGVPPPIWDMVLSGTASAHANVALKRESPCQWLPFGENTAMYQDYFSKEWKPLTIGTSTNNSIIAMNLSLVVLLICLRNSSGKIPPALVVELLKARGYM